MIKGLTLSRYLGRQYLLWFVVFLVGLSGIIYLFEVAELLRRSANNNMTTLPIVLEMGSYKLPDTIEKILPFVVLFSVMFTFWRLTRNQELVVVRAAGVSVWQFLGPTLFVTLIFGWFNMTILNPIGASMNARYQEMDNLYFSRSPSLELTGSGLWLRQKDEKKRYLLHADHVDLEPLTLIPVIAFVYDDKDHYLGRVDAQKAILHEQGKNSYWEFNNVWFNWENQMPEKKDSYHLNTSLTLDKIQESMSPPNTVSFWQLPRFIEALESIGLPTTRHVLQFQLLLAEPFLLCAMVCFAAVFSLRLSRQGGILNAAMLGIFTGSLIFSANNVAMAMGTNQTLPVFLAAWAVPLAALTFSNALLLKLEDG